MRRVIAFAFAYMPFAALQTSVAVQLPKFFATTLGLGAAAGAIFGVVRMIDIPIDPALGLTMDRTRTPIGRYRPWLIIAAPILMVAIYMLYQAQPGVSRGYLTLWLLIMYIGMSCLLVGANSWASTLATSYTDRSRIFGAMATVGVVSAASALIVPIVADMAGRTEAEGIRLVGWFLLGLAPVAIAAAVFVTPERITKDAPGRRFRAVDYATLMARPNVIRLVIADFFVTLGPGWMSALYLFFFELSRGFSVAESNILLTIYILAGFVGSPAAAWLSNRISKHGALMINTTAYSAMLVIIFSMAPGNFPLMAPCMLLAGAFASGFTVIIRSMTADIGDEIRLEGGRDLIGLLYALTSATTKAASALAVFITYRVLDSVGFNFKNVEANGPEQIRGLELAYVIGPIVFVMLAGACFFGYRLTAARHAEIRLELDARDAASAETR